MSLCLQIQALVTHIHTSLPAPSLLSLLHSPHFRYLCCLNSALTSHFTVHCTRRSLLLEVYEKPRNVKCRVRRVTSPYLLVQAAISVMTFFVENNHRNSLLSQYVGQSTPSVYFYTSFGNFYLIRKQNKVGDAIVLRFMTQGAVAVRMRVRSPKYIFGDADVS